MAVPAAPRLRHLRHLTHPRHLRRVVVVGAVGLLLAGCNGSVPEERVQRNQRLAAELARDLEATGRFTRVFVGYADDATNDRALSISISCTACSPAATLQDALEAAWKSPIAPVRGFLVSVTNTKTLKERYRFIRNARDRAQMTRRYGPRPTGEADGAGPAVEGLP